MKKIFFALLVFLVGLSCSKQELTTDIEASSSISINLNSSIEGYKGIFTTLDSKHRATVDIIFPDFNEKSKRNFPYAILTFSNGKEMTLEATKNYTKGEYIDNLVFQNNHLTFTLEGQADGSNTTITNAIFNEVESTIKLAPLKLGDPLPFTYTGTYTCDDCTGHPVLDTGVAQTFNMLFEYNSALSEFEIKTQIILNENDFGSDTGNVYGECELENTITTCPVNGVSYNNAIIWSGFRIEDTTIPCSGVSGIWSFNYGPVGVLNGTFESDNACPPVEVTLIDEDFEDNMVAYVATFEDTSNETSDYFRITDGSDIIAVFNGIQGNQFFGAQDIDGVGTNGVSPASLTWSNLDITNLSSFTFSGYFAEDDDGNSQDWDTGDYTVVQYSFDGTNWTTFFGIQADPNTYTGGNSSNGIPKVDTNLDGEGDGIEITDTFVEFSATFENNPTNNPTGATTLFIRIESSLNSGDEDIAFDNILLIGE